MPAGRVAGISRDVTAVVSSPLIRCTRTAELIAAAQARANAHVEMEVARARMMSEMYAVLTPEQKADIIAYIQNVPDPEPTPAALGGDKSGVAAPPPARLRPEQVRPLQLQRLGAGRVRVLVLADAGKDRLRTGLVHVRLGPSGWEVR